MSTLGPHPQPTPPPFIPKTVCVGGTYDGGIIGWEVVQKSPTAAAAAQEGASSSASLKLTFAYTPHQGSVRALAIPTQGVKAGLLLVSGGSDEHIRMYDLRRRTEVGELLHHKGTITALAFVGSSHLLSASEDGSVCIWRVYDWSLVHILGGHKGAVTSIAVHPSGKLALSTGRDRSLRLWDLVKGRCAYITKLEAVAEVVKWSLDGMAYALLVGEKRLEVRRTVDNQTTCVLTHPLRITALAFLPTRKVGQEEQEQGQEQEQHIITACDDGHLRVVDGKTGVVLSTTDVSSTCGRIKETAVLHDSHTHTHTDEDDEECERQMLTASSDGKVILWSIDAEGKTVTPGPSASQGDGVRITCLSAYAAAAASGGGNGEGEGVVVGGKKKNKKRKHKKVQGEEEKEEEVGERRDSGMQKQKKKKKKDKQKNKNKGGQSPAASHPQSSSSSSSSSPAQQKQKKQQQQQQKQQQQPQESGSSSSGGGKKKHKHGGGGGKKLKHI